MSQHERMVQMFAAIDDDGRRFILVMLQGEYERVQAARRPVLKLVPVSQRQRSAGFASPLALVLIALAMMLFAAYFPALSSSPESPQAPPPAPTSNAGIAYAPFVFLDTVTGCQYLSTHMSTGLVPRIAADGETHMGCKGVAR